MLVVTHDVLEAVILADGIVVIEAGMIAMDIAVGMPLQGRRGSPPAAALETSILDRLLTDRIWDGRVRLPKAADEVD